MSRLAFRKASYLSIPILLFSNNSSYPDYQNVLADSCEGKFCKTEDNVDRRSFDFLGQIEAALKDDLNYSNLESVLHEIHTSLFRRDLKLLEDNCQLVFDYVKNQLIYNSRQKLFEKATEQYEKLLTLSDAFTKNVSSTEEKMRKLVRKAEDEQRLRKGDIFVGGCTAAAVAGGFAFAAPPVAVCGGVMMAAWQFFKSLDDSQK